MVQLSRNKGIVCWNTRASKAQQKIYSLSGKNWGIGEREKLSRYSQTGEQLNKENVWNKGNKKTRKSLSPKNTPGHVFESYNETFTTDYNFSSFMRKNRFILVIIRILPNENYFIWIFELKYLKTWYTTEWTYCIFFFLSKSYYLKKNFNRKMSMKNGAQHSFNSIWYLLSAMNTKRAVFLVMVNSSRHSCSVSGALCIVFKETMDFKV